MRSTLCFTCQPDGVKVESETLREVFTLRARNSNSLEMNPCAHRAVVCPASELHLLYFLRSLYFLKICKVVAARFLFDKIQIYPDTDRARRLLQLKLSDLLEGVAQEEADLAAVVARFAFTLVALRPVELRFDLPNAGYLLLLLVEIRTGELVSHGLRPEQTQKSLKVSIE